MFDNRKININLQNLIIFSSLSVVLVAWIGSLLAVLGAFKLLIPILLIIACSFCILALALKTKLEFDISRNEIILVFSVILLATANGYFYHESIEHGRDHGPYVSSAINIAKTGYFEAKEEYMHTYPSYFIRAGKIISMPYPAYSSFLAVMYSLFGIYGIFWSNTIFFLLFLLIMYLIGIEFGHKKIGIIFIMLFLTHYLTIWFTRRTNNETFFMFLLWLAVYLFLKGYTSKEKSFFYLSLFPLSIIPIVRLEGFLYYISFSLAFLFFILREGKVRVKNISQFFIILIFLSMPLYISDFTRETILNTLPVIRSQSQQALATSETQTGAWWEVFNQNIHRFTFDMFTYYLLTPLFIILIIYILRRRYNFGFILILILISPAFYFLINPSISPDQPWFMRRFWPHIVVLLFFVPSIILGNMRLEDNRTKLIFGIGLILLLSGNLIYSSRIITFSEDRGLVEQLNNLDKKLPENTCIIGTQYIPSRFLIPMHFLFDRCFINDRIEQDNWRKITIDELARFVPEDKDIIIVSLSKELPKEEMKYYFNNFDLKYISNFTIKVPRIDLTADFLGYQKPIPADIRTGKTKITYEWIEEMSRGTPPTNISINSFEFFIFGVYRENNKLELFRKNIFLLDGWERRGEYLTCVSDECSFRSLIWNNSIILNVSYTENSTGNFTFYNNESKSKVNIPLSNSSLSLLVSPRKMENRFTVSKGVLIKNISARYAKEETLKNY
ncbi:Uncharacterised protein [uncultured archaeon]|nr:Uncharacterised protein [uncultured archaeon]